MVYKHKLLSNAKNHSDLQKSIIKNYLSLMEAIRILDEERLSQPGYKTRQFPPKIKAVADTLVGRVFQPMKAGLFDVFRRSNDEESLVLRCLQKSKLESDLQRLRELGYSGVSQFKALSDVFKSVPTQIIFVIPESTDLEIMSSISFLNFSSLI